MQLTPADFTPIETNYYQTLDPAARQNFIVTRSFVRISQQVTDGVLPPSQLPDRPTGFSTTYLLPGDPFDINNALSDYLVTTHGGRGNLVSDMTTAQMLRPSDLSPTELTYSQTLSSKADARHSHGLTYAHLTSGCASRFSIRSCRPINFRKRHSAYAEPICSPESRT